MDSDEKFVLCKKPKFPNHVNISFQDQQMVHTLKLSLKFLK